MSMDKIFGIAGSALNAQMVRLNASASNIANAGSTASSEVEAYKAKRPIFETVLSEQQNNLGGVKVVSLVDDQSVHGQIHDPGNPNADENGIVYLSNVNEVGEMVEMMAAARSYQNNVEVINTARQLMLRTLEITKI
ncbi:MAG: flagellar basal body rod protein FlgC [SAR92 clade bacterium]|jgi:flagellar basal-body rod protein FlgC|uniref:Flagellar basal-body rod protein FlgC n=1 Tax=SAR92 clade bacterium TaxID=2315479 RepID=A0A520MFT3_9GAMM|nr:MAG: flagellar basal body rod protein FlgC [SAR92 clade bacterium]